MARWTPSKGKFPTSLPLDPTDAAFVVRHKGKEVKVGVHKALLAHYSDHFKPIFYPLVEEPQDGNIVVPGRVTKGDVKALVDVLYGTTSDLSTLSLHRLKGLAILNFQFKFVDLDQAIVAAAMETKITQETLPDIIDTRTESCWPEGFSAALSEAAAGYIKNLPAKQRVVEAASCLHLAALKSSLAKVMVVDDMASLLKEYQRFMAIKVLVGDVTSPQRFSPSPLVDQVWHAHLQHPRHYLAACRALGEDMPIDHDPTTASDALEDKLRRVARTKVMYREVFGEAPSNVFWSLSMGSMQIFVKAGSPTITLSVDHNTSVETTKLLIQFMEGIPSDQQRHIFGGKQMEDGKTLADYNVGNEDTIFLCLRGLRGLCLRLRGC